MKSPAFQFYPDDFYSGTADMSQRDVGAYIRLLCHQWGRGLLPADTEKMQRLAGGPVSEDVLAKFPIWEDGARRNNRMEKERAKQAEYRGKQSNNGAAGAKKRWEQNDGGGNSDANSDASSGAIDPPQPTPSISPLATLQPKHSSPSPSPSPSLSPDSVPVSASEGLQGVTVPTKPKRSPGRPVDEDWLKELESDSTYAGIQIRIELGKMTRWCAERRKQPSRKRFINWLNGVDRPINANDHNPSRRNGPGPRQNRNHDTGAPTEHLVAGGGNHDEQRAAAVAEHERHRDDDPPSG